jgi:hypothetical protein
LPGIVLVPGLHGRSHRLPGWIVQKDVILKAPLLHARTRDESWRRLKDL